MLLKSPVSAHQDRSVTWQQERRSFDHAHEIVKPWGQIEQVLDWCKSECTHEWRWQLVEVSSDRKPGRYIFYFDSERDCLAFVMKWA
jgi:hypothetical protein